MEMNVTPAVEQKNGVQQAALQQLKAGANWFYWIAAFSIINCLVTTFGGDMYFVIGLGFNHLINGIIYGLAGTDFNDVDTAVKVFALIVNIFVSSGFILLGVFANKRYDWAFIVGMIIYALDGLIFLIISDFLSIAFHALALFWIYKGYSASRKLKKLEMQEMIEKTGLAQPIR
jgi:hypothetical protein